MTFKAFVLERYQAHMIIIILANMKYYISLNMLSKFKTFWYAAQKAQGMH